MPDIKLKTRIQNKYKPLNEWNTLTKGEFIPLLGEVCYAVENGTLYQKIGDGVTDFTELEWLYSPAIQSDHEENDETSAAYIKNRLAYTGINQVPEAEQEMGYFSDPDEPAFDCQVVNIESEIGQTPESLGLPATMTEIVQCMAAQPYMLNDSDAIDKIKDINNTFSLSVGEPGNIYTFDFDASNCVETMIEDYLYHVFLSGNPVVANLLLQALEPPEPIVFPTDKDTELEYALVLLVVDLGSDGIAMQPVFVGDTDIYYATDPDAITFSMKHLTEQYIKQIEEKYLTNATKFVEQSDQNEMNSSKQSYIKNRYGDIVILYSADDDIADKDNYYHGTVVLGKKYTDGFEVESETITQYIDTESLGTPGGLFGPSTFAVSLNGTLYKRCPILIQRDILRSLTNISASAIHIGNPKFISEMYNTLFSNTSAEELAANLALTQLEDNGLPFLIEFDPENELPLQSCTTIFLDETLFTQGDSVEIKIIPDSINYSTNQLPKKVLPIDTANTPFIYDTNKEAIMSRTAYSATGVNSFALGEGAKATADNAIAIGQNARAQSIGSVALGLNSNAASQNAFAINGGLATGIYCLASGYDTQSGGNSSFAMGHTCCTLGTQSVALGVCAKATASRSFVFGTGNEVTYTYTTTRPTTTTVIIPADASSTLTEDIAKTFVVCRPAEYSSWIAIKSCIRNEDGTYTITLPYSISVNYTQFTFKGKNGIHSGAIGSVLFGTGTIASSNSFLFGDGYINATYGIAMGQGLQVSAENQFAIGKYNLSPENTAFVIGNGTSEAQSNALTVDWNGNLKAAGSIETTSVILSAPNGTKFNVSIDDDGVLTATEITE